MTAGQLCSRIVASVAPDESVRVAAQRMAEFDVGTLVVLKENRGSHAVGVVTDRDIVLRCLAERLDPSETPVSEIMTSSVETISNDASIEDALAKMGTAGTRRIVVTGEGDRVAGVLSLDDVLALIARQTAAIGRLLEKQQPKIPA
jgi:CBS domain-containing protein